MCRPRSAGFLATSATRWFISGILPCSGNWATTWLWNSRTWAIIRRTASSFGIQTPARTILIRILVATRIGLTRPSAAFPSLIRSGAATTTAPTAKLDKRYSSGLNFTTSYTYGHALADTGTTLTGSGGSKDNRNIAAGYASAAWDIRHSLVSSVLYDLPFGKGKRWLNSEGPISWIVGNWQLNSVLTFRTGAPFTLGTLECVGTFGTCQPDVLPGKDPKNAPAGGRRPQEWFDTSAVVAPAPGTPGTLGVQSNNRPGQRNVDLSLFKDFPFTERLKIQFRAEAFNIANTPQWGIPDLTQGDAAFGQITSTQPNTQRHVQFALRFMF